MTSTSCCCARPRRTAGNAASISGYASYDEYGNPESGAVSTGADSYGWLGTKQRADDGTGLTLMGARLYNPTTGRFTCVDPKAGGNANAYNYPDDPINQMDLSGDKAKSSKKASSKNSSMNMKSIVKAAAAAATATGISILTGLATAAICAGSAMIGCAGAIVGAYVLTASATGAVEAAVNRKNVTKGAVKKMHDPVEVFLDTFPNIVR